MHPGDTLVSASSSASLVQSYAAKAADGTLRVLLVNDDPSNTYNVSLSYNGFIPSSAAPSVATLAPPGTGITTASQGTAGGQVLAPYTAELEFTRASQAETRRRRRRREPRPPRASPRHRSA